MNVLLTCVGRRHYLVDFFRQALGSEGRVVGTDMDITAPAMTACDARHIVPSVFDEGYLERIVEIAKLESIDMVFSVNDLEQGLLAEHRNDLDAETGAVFYVPSPRTERVCSDKWETFCFVKSVGVSAPATYLDPKLALDAIRRKKIAFPLMVKPRWGSASIALHRVYEEKDLELSFEACRSSTERSALAALGSEESVIVQEIIEGPEYGVDLLYGKDERFIGFTAKRKLAMRAGETDKAVTVPPDRFLASIEKMAQNLPHRGNLDCDFLERDGELFLLEMNPRFGGGYPFTHLAGANHVEMLINDQLGLPLPHYEYSYGKAFSKFDSLVEVENPLEKKITP